MNVILLLMFFITPAAPGPKDESKSIWTLQSTSHIELHSADACHKIGRQLIHEFDDVATVTLRAYCLCEDGTGKVCPEETIHGLKAEKGKPTLEPLGRY
jgi:hypothetical protein